MKCTDNNYMHQKEPNSGEKLVHLPICLPSSPICSLKHLICFSHRLSDEVKNEQFDQSQSERHAGTVKDTLESKRNACPRA
jgi:hypothetical protein